MKCFFFSSNNVEVNNKHRKCETFLKGGVKENGGILLLILNMKPAPSSGHFLNHAKTKNLMKLLLIDYRPGTARGCEKQIFVYVKQKSWDFT